MEFSYSIKVESSVTDSEDSFCAAREPSENELVTVQRSPEGAIMLLANEEGWLYLAKICVEMAYTYKADPYYHFHRTSEFTVASTVNKEEIGFFHIDDEGAQDLKRKRQLETT